MKRLLTIITTGLLIISCSDKNQDYNDLLGSWKMKDVINNTGEDFHEKFTFYKGDSVVTELFVNGKVQQRFKEKFTLDKKTGIIRLKVGAIIFERKIEKLTKDELEIKDLNSGKTIRCVRF